MRLVRREFDGLHQSAFKRFQERADFVAHLAGCAARDRSTGHRSDVHEIVDELLDCVFARGADPYTMMTSAQEQFQSRAVRLLPCGPVCRVAERRAGVGLQHQNELRLVRCAAREGKDILDGLRSFGVCPLPVRFRARPDIDEGFPRRGESGARDKQVYRRLERSGGRVRPAKDKEKRQRAGADEEHQSAGVNAEPGLERNECFHRAWSYLESSDERLNRAPFRRLIPAESRPAERAPGSAERRGFRRPSVYFGWAMMSSTT